MVNLEKKPLSERPEVTDADEQKTLIMEALDRGVIDYGTAIWALKEAEKLDDQRFLDKVKREVYAICPDAVREFAGTDKK